MPNSDDTSSLLGKHLSSLRNKKKAVLSKLSKSKESSPAKSLHQKQVKNDNDVLIDYQKPQLDVESGVEVVEDMVFVPSISLNDEPNKLNLNQELELLETIQQQRPVAQIPMTTESSPAHQILDFVIKISTKESFLFALLAVLITLILRLSLFWQGAFTTGFLMLLYHNICDYLRESVLNRPSESKFQLLNKFQSTYIPYEKGGIEEHRPIKSYRGWMNIIEKYDPETYSVSQTQSTYVKLDGSSLRISYTKSKISKRHLWNETVKKSYPKNFTHQKFFELKGATVELWPRGLARKRYYSRKYPIRVVLVPESQGSDKNTPTNDTEMVNDYDLEFKDCTDDEPEVLYLFARCDREKEDWFRQMRAASLGDVHDPSGEFQIKSKNSSRNSSFATTPVKEPLVTTDQEMKKRDSKDSNSTKELDGDDFERIEREIFTFDSMIQPCSARTSMEFLQFIKAYVVSMGFRYKKHYS